MAGAEEIEPSARGFGVDVEKVLHHSAFHTFQPLASFRLFASLPFDAFLMLFAYEMRLPARIVHEHKRYDAERLRVLKIYVREYKEIETSSINKTNITPLGVLPTSGARRYFPHFPLLSLKL